MTVRLNHTIISAHDNRASAEFLSAVLGVPVRDEVGHFVRIQLENDVTLDFMHRKDFTPEHYAFLVDDATFDAAYEKLTRDGVTTWADPGHTKPGELNTGCGGRGFYFEDPAGHNMELLTKAE